MKYKFTITFTIIVILTLLITITPAIADSGTLEVTNLSNITYNFTLQQLEEISKTSVYADLYCYGSLLTSGEWGGVQLSYLLNQTDMTPDVNSIQFLAADNYAVSIPLQLAQSPQTIIAYQKNGQPLPEGLRLVLPGYNGASWIAQIESITLSNDIVITPSSISIDGSIARSLLSDFGREIFPTPTYSTPIPTPKPTTQNPTPTPTAAPTNNTIVESPPKPETADVQSSGSDIRTVATIAVIFVVGLAIAILAYNRKTKLQNAPQKLPIKIFSLCHYIDS